MIVLNKYKNSIINFDLVTQIFKGADDLSIKVKFLSGEGTQLERYSSVEEADIALELLCKAIGQIDKFVMPNDEQIKAHIIATKDVGKEYHKRYRGKKYKKVGGS